MTTRRVIAVLMLVVGGAAGRATTAQPSPLDPFRPCVVLTTADVERLDTGATLVRTLDEDDGNVAVFGARRVAADGDRLVAWLREIEQLKQSRLVEGIARFSNPPAGGDLVGVRLDPAELAALRECRPGNCRVKLTAAEIDLVRREIDAAGGQWRARAEDAFRQVMLNRVRAYRSGGLAAVGHYEDGRSPHPLEVVGASLVSRSPCLRDLAPALADYLTRPPSPPAPDLESYFYWSKERVAGRPLISATHVAIARPAGPGGSAVAAGRQLFATHYLNGSLNITAVVGSGPGTPHYLVVLNRTNADVLSGLFGGLARWSVERRLRSELAGILDQLARRLEGGLPSVPKYSAADAWRDGG